MNKAPLLPPSFPCNACSNVPTYNYMYQAPLLPPHPFLVMPAVVMFPRTTTCNPAKTDYGGCTVRKIILMVPDDGSVIMDEGEVKS